MAIVKRLLEDSRVQPSPKFNNVILLAEKQGKEEILELLLSDARTSQNWKTQTTRRRFSNTLRSLSSPRTKPRILIQAVEEGIVRPIKHSKYAKFPDVRHIKLVDSLNSNSGSQSAISLDNSTQ